MPDSEDVIFDIVLTPDPCTHKFGLVLAKSLLSHITALTVKECHNIRDNNNTIRVGDLLVGIQGSPIKSVADTLVYLQQEQGPVLFRFVRHHHTPSSSLFISNTVIPSLSSLEELEEKDSLSRREYELARIMLETTRENETLRHSLSQKKKELQRAQSTIEKLREPIAKSKLKKPSLFKNFGTFKENINPSTSLLEEKIINLENQFKAQVQVMQEAVSSQEETTTTTPHYLEFIKDQLQNHGPNKCNNTYQSSCHICQLLQVFGKEDKRGEMTQ